METTRKLSLPSGGTCKVRRLTPRDFLKVGTIPDVLADPGKHKDAKADKDASLAYSIRMNEVILCDCLSPITDAKGNLKRVVNKSAFDCSDSEENCDLFATSDDGAAVVEAVLELSGFRESDREALVPFPQAADSNGEHRQALPTVSESAVGSAGS